MQYTIQINQSPNDSCASYTAYRLIIALIERRHTIKQIFFYQEGIFCAFKYATPPDDELQMTAKWQSLAAKHNIDLLVCVSSAQRRGLLTYDEAGRRGKAECDLADGFAISGLGQLVEATVLSDRFIQF